MVWRQYRRLIGSRNRWRLPTALAAAAIAILPAASMADPSPAGRAAHPNIVIILADDMGFSDVACYGSEIATPHLDQLAAEGVRFTQFYNAARCCPTRASLLTGLYPHQCGVGHMTADRGLPGYRGRLNENSVTIAQVLRRAGYRTFMSGKWHLGMQRQHWPVEYGFERYFGQLSGACNYFRPEPRRVMALDGQVYSPPEREFYITDAITDYAVRFLDEAGRTGDRPFFLYVAYTAPHAPLHALPEDIAKYRGKYRDGWDAIRRRRYERMLQLGIVQEAAVRGAGVSPASAPGERRDPQGGPTTSEAGRMLAPQAALSPRAPDVPAWQAVQDVDEQDLRMAVYAAQIDRMDQGIGRILARIEQLGVRDNTLVLFLSDNGGDAEDIDEGKPGAPVGTAESYRGYAAPWANVSNTPFRGFKRQVHEGGIATPLIVSWPAVIHEPGRITHEVGHVIDLMATCCDAAGVAYPSDWDGRKIVPTPGRSLLPALTGEPLAERECLFWEHEGNRAVRCGDYKLVAVHGGAWELYDLRSDRTELNDLAGARPDLVQWLSARYAAWAAACGVVDWDQVPARNAGH